MKSEIGKRLAPFLALLDAKYLPLLFAVAPQSYNVFLWLWLHSDQSGAAYNVAMTGAIGYEFVYVGAIAWAEEERSSIWTWATAVLSLLFSIGVAVYVNLDEGYWSVLHAGFPLVAFAYTLNMYIATNRRQPATAPVDTSTIAATEIVPEATKVQFAQPTVHNLRTVEQPRNPGKLAGVDVPALVARHNGNLSAAATEAGVSRQAIDKQLRRNGATAQ